ncbi:NAD(P)-binding domain-containing protein [Gammaproteobacteria bacterium]|nr:NAD(P)-binding domain-containing protein [Gammaproteobacteria bacterium]
MNILITTKLPRTGFDSIENHTLIYPTETYFTPEDILDKLPITDILVPTFDYPITAEMMDLAPNLKLIANAGVGFNNINIEAATQRGIQVTNTPYPVIDPTAEQALTLMLSVAHNTAMLDRKLRLKNSPIQFSVMQNLGISIQGKTLGILGMGRIGQCLAQKAQALGMSVIYHNRHQLDTSIEQKCHANYKSQEEVLQQSDFLSLNMPYMPETHHLISTKEFSMMKTGAVLINTARGPIVDEAALITALKSKKLYGAGIDVFEFEPHISPELLELDNVVLSPHIATGTTDCREDMARHVSKNINAFINHASQYDKVNQLKK